jgi:hypothetical protein
MTSVFLLALLVSLTPQDESDIRQAIEERAKIENSKPSPKVWSERGSKVYRIQSMEAVSDDVATADAEGVRTGAFSSTRQYVFILKRANGHWAISRQLEVVLQPAPVRIQPVVTP